MTSTSEITFSNKYTHVGSISPNTYGMEFYNIDKITEGDYMFLEFRGKEYVYLFEESFVTEDTDWSPIKTKDYGCITLQSCTPINVASHRIFVVGCLTEIRTPDKNEAVIQ